MRRDFGINSQFDGWTEWHETAGLWLWAVTDGETDLAHGWAESRHEAKLHARCVAYGLTARARKAVATS